MKTNGLFALAFLALAVFAFAFVLAEENSTDTIVLDDSNESIFDDDNQTELDNSSVSDEIEDADEELETDVSSWDINRERMKNWFTFNQEKKAQREFKIARLLLVKARIEARNNDTEAIDEALDAHNRIIERLELRIRERQESENSSDDATKLVGLEKAIQEHQIRISRLNLMLEAENLTDEQRANIEERIAKAQEVIVKLDEVHDDKITRLRLKLMAKGNLTEEQVDLVISELEEFNQIKQLKEAVKEAQDEAKELRKSIREISKMERERLREEAKDFRKFAKELRKQNRTIDDSDDDSDDDEDDSSQDDDSNDDDSDDDEDDSSQDDDSNDDDSDDDSDDNDSSNSGSGSNN